MRHTSHSGSTFATTSRQSRNRASSRMSLPRAMGWGHSLPAETETGSDFQIRIKTASITKDAAVRGSMVEKNCPMDKP